MGKGRRFAAVLKEALPHTVTVPHLPARACTEVQQLGKSFAAFINEGDRSTILRGYVRKWLGMTFAEFDRVGLGKMVAAAGA